VKAKFSLSQQAQTIVDTLKDVLDAGVMLQDDDKEQLHLAMRDEWWSFKLERPEPNREGPGCVVEKRINDRWTLIVSSRRGLHPDAESLVTWAADKLAVHLPKNTADDELVPPSGSGGGSGGSAETGIPVWWERKRRN